MSNIHQIDERHSRAISDERKKELNRVLDNLNRIQTHMTERKALYKNADDAMSSGSLTDMMKARDALAAKIAEKKHRLAS